MGRARGEGWAGLGVGVGRVRGEGWKGADRGDSIRYQHTGNA